MKIEYTKWDGSLHWHFDVDELGADARGLWLGGRAGCQLQRGHEESIYARHAFVCLIPATGRWIATFHAGGDVRLYIDVTNEPTRSGDCVHAIDLDLDVLRWADGRVTLDDEDEFDEHRVAFGYPDDVAAKARATAAELLDAVRASEEPFAAASSTWLARMA
ncbi:MAG: uncharacterized protein V7636_703 [Actinomycetota bacterium]